VKTKAHPAPVGHGVAVLDFDGVICDSVDECLAASFLAAYELQGLAAPAGGPAARRERFARMRVFIRSGEDYLLIHRLIDAGVEVRDQAGFDGHVRGAGRQEMARFHELFYRGRRALIERDRDAWLAMNRIYPQARAALRAAAGRPLFILSTKRPEYIHEILGHAGIPVPPAQVLYSGEDPKLPLVEKLRVDGGFARAAFVDDQVDHLLGNPFPLVSVHLASWGYVASLEPARLAGIPVLDAAELPGLVASVTGGGAGHGDGGRVQ
jgi:FMN phosphatase YigB (HAD superfamily)